MNRARVKNLLLNTASVFASVTESVPFTHGNLILNIVHNRISILHATSAALKQKPKKTMPVFPDSS